MRGLLTGVLLGCAALLARAQPDFTFSPDWEDLDRRPNPEWFEDQKFGLFIRWGVPALPPIRPDESYPTRARRFEAELFDPAAWARLFRRAGAQFVILPSKDQDGFALWPSAQSWNWNSTVIGPHLDVVGALVDATREVGMRVGLAYTLEEPRNPQFRHHIDRYARYHVGPQLQHLVQRYRPDILWTEAGTMHSSATLRSEEVLAWLYTFSPVRHFVAVNDQWGTDTPGRHGGFNTYTTRGTEAELGARRRSRNAWTFRRHIGSSSFYDRTATLTDYADAQSLIYEMIDVVSHGGSYVLSLGPTADGRIPVIVQERLAEIGDWLAVNGEAIYNSRPWRETREGEFVRYTRRGSTVYAILLRWPGTELVLEEPNLSIWSRIHLIGHDGPLTWRRDDTRLVIDLPELEPDEMPSRFAYVIRMTIVN